ncbi:MULTISPECIES: outer membrane protein [Bradyrhizobium]|nr:MULTISPECIES: outer membrane protein [Bradyrhizobium]
MSYPVKAPVITPVQAFSWTGFYVGANVGFGGDRFEYPFHASARQLQAEAPPLTSSTSGKFSLTSSGFFGGGQIGYNHQYNSNVVLGLEADFQWSGIEGRFEGNQILTVNGTSVATTFGTGSEIAWFGTVRGRLGYAWDRLFLYATGGAAYGKVDTHGTFSFAGPNGVAHTTSVASGGTQWGWTAGAGLEYALAPQWSFKTEYLYIDLGSRTLLSSAINDVANGFTANAGMDVDTKFHTIKAGVNYRF